MFVVDTNVLVYAADRSSPFHARSVALLDRLRGEPVAWYLTWGIVYEFLRVTTHPRVMRQPWTTTQAWQFIEALLASPSVSVLTHTDRHASVGARIWGDVPFVAGNLVHDAHTAALMREHGIRRIYTRDTDFHRFPFVEPIDPMTG
jgi:toxin-antitoxin system PIN domain toxin